MDICKDLETAPSTISVIISNYNYEQYVGAAIDSVLAQTRPADEIIVLDDGSTDGSRAVIESYGNQVRAIFQENEGIKTIRNTGYTHSTGGFVIFLDADDTLYPRALEYAEKAFRPGTAKVQFELDVIDQDGGSLGRRYCNFPPNIDADQIAKEFSQTGTYSWPVTSGNVYSREFLSQVMPVAPPSGIDGVLNTIAPLYGDIVTITEPMGQYRIHLRNNSRKNTLGDTNIIPDFALRIRLRKREFDLLRQHAASFEKVIPNIDFLDSELVFINYRLMARKLRNEDGRDADRSLADLWRTAMRVVMLSPFHWTTRIKHIVWLTGLTIAPTSLARMMIVTRFNRSHLRSKFRNWISQGSTS
jgi:glycosyltransferase involved in cell wall biosynthesis